MERYYRVRSPLSNQTYQLTSEFDWDATVAYYGDRLIGEVDQSGMLKRFNVPRTVKANIDKLLLSMNADNVEEVTHQVNKLHQAALPDYRMPPVSMVQMHLDTYNNVIIPALYPEENCKVCESPMLREIFPELFKDVQVMPEIVKVVDGKQVVDTDAVDERSRRMHLHRHEREAEEAVAAMDDFDQPPLKRVGQFAAAFEQQTIITPAEGGITITLPRNGLKITFKKPTTEELHRNIEPPKQKSAYDLWLEEGNQGEIGDFVAEIARAAYMTHGSDYKEIVKYYRSENGVVVIRKSNKGDYSVNHFPTNRKFTADLPEIKGVILKGSKLPIQIDDREVRTQVESFLESHYAPHLAAQVLEKLDTIAEVEKKQLVDILPPHIRRIIDALKFGKGHIESAIAMLKDIQSNKPEVEEVEVSSDTVIPSLTQYEQVLEMVCRDTEPRIVLEAQPYSIQEQFQKFLKRCDEDFKCTTTPSSYDREHFERVYQRNREDIGHQLGLVLTPHLLYQGVKRNFMVDGVEHNTFRVLRNTRDSYRPLVTVRFVKGFFNIEMH